ncbi:MAG: twin-arginine translocase TatA/TatE family subunit, partial [Deltaproteobacteria bacterium]|nr:twin-arginine translocase TatA/TatE family subunit [Deltaproteobacteria bacterium]
MFGLGTTELVIIAIIVFLIFGAKRIPDIGKGLGGAIREFRKVKKEISPEKQDTKDSLENEDKTENPTAIEKKLAEKVVEQIPGVKQVMDT